jgi:hypothetical protein
VACAIHKTMVVASSDGTSSKVPVKTQSLGWGLWATQTFGASVCRYAATSFRSKLRINSVRIVMSGLICCSARHAMSLRRLVAQVTIQVIREDIPIAQQPAVDAAVDLLAHLVELLRVIDRHRPQQHLVRQTEPSVIGRQLFWISDAHLHLVRARDTLLFWNSGRVTGKPSLTRRWPFGRVTERLPTILPGNAV